LTEDLLPLRGSPGSPYTRKMLGIVRYRRIPYRFIQADRAELPRPKVSLVPVVYFEGADGELVAEVDSTPIIRRLEAEYPGRSVIPDDPAIAFINYLLEDYGDEWLTKAMFHYRWHYAADIDMAGSVLPHYADVTQSDERMLQMKKLFSERQISRLYVVGSNDATSPVIEASYVRFMEALNAHLASLPFLPLRAFRGFMRG
jgi:glutathione S-transferase